MDNRFGPVFEFTPGQVVETIDGLVGYVKCSEYNYSDCSEYNYSGYTWHGHYYRILVQDNYNFNNHSYVEAKWHVEVKRWHYVKRWYRESELKSKEEIKQ